MDVNGPHSATVTDVLRGRARAHGAELAFQVDGPRDAPALLLLPGQANSHHWWDGLRDALSVDHRTVTFDYRGTGDTSATEEPWTTTSFAVDAATVLTHLGITAADVYGTSMGGRVAQILAIEHAATVRQLVLACSSPGGPHAFERSNAVRRRLADPDDDARRAALTALFYTPSWAATHPISPLFGDPSMTPGASRLHLRVSGRHDAYDRLPQITAPTLVLHGTDDQMVPAGNADVIAGRVPGATRHLTEGGRHGFFDEFADDITPRVLDFLDR